MFILPSPPIPFPHPVSLPPSPLLLPFLFADAEWKLLLITEVSSRGTLPHWGEIFCIEHVTVMSLIEDAHPESSRLEVCLILPTPSLTPLSPSSPPYLTLTLTILPHPSYPLLPPTPSLFYLTLSISLYLTSLLSLSHLSLTHTHTFLSHIHPLLPHPLPLYLPLLFGTECVTDCLHFIGCT